MIIVEMNQGPKIPYVESKTRVTLDDDLSINLAAREADWDVHIDVCYDEDGTLVIGAAAGRAYVAQFDIPARQYTEDSAEVDGDTVTTRTPVPLGMKKVTMSLWAIAEERS